MEAEQSWQGLLKKYIKNNPPKSKEEQEKEACDLFLEYMKDDEKQEIPKFFYKKPISMSDIYFSVKVEAKTRHLGLKRMEIPEKGEMKDLWFVLRNHCSQPSDDTERINYMDFKKASKEASSSFTAFFSATNFLKFDKDKYGRIEIVAFFHYVVRKTNIERYKIDLMNYDEIGEGFLTDKDLENYIRDEMADFHFADQIKEDSMEYYLLVASRKFFFFLDPKRTGKIYIKDIVTSPIIIEFAENKDKTTANENGKNWFSLKNFWNIYKSYVDLDKDKNGMLSNEEMQEYSPGITKIFIDRVFEEYQKYENEIDFKQYIDFILAMENKKSEASIFYIWRCIDVYHMNAVDTFVLNMFFKEIVGKVDQRDQGYKEENLKDEIWDMVKPKNKLYLTLQDILASPYADTVLSILIDARAFFMHDQREKNVPF